MGRPDVSHLPYESSFVPEILTDEHKIKFACHPGVSCFNACCKQADDMLKEQEQAAQKKAQGK